MFCSECGQQNRDDAKFCMKCGKKFISIEAISSPAKEHETSKDQTTKDSNQGQASLSGEPIRHASKELKDSGTVTAMSVIGFVFGLIGMLGSFVPCIGALAFYIGIPAAIVSAVGLGIAYSQNAKRTFAIVAVTISLIGVVISGWQYFSIVSAGKQAQKELQQMFVPSTPMPKPTPVPAPAIQPTPVPKQVTNVNESGIELTIQNFYQAVQDKRVDDAINMFSAEKKPNIKVNLIQGVAKDTEYYKIDSINVVNNDGIHAGTIVILRHKKYGRSEEKWEINVALIKENDSWKIVSTPGRKL